MKCASWPVTAKHGPRPAGRPTHCFYCDEPLGNEHKNDCVMRERTIVIKVEIELVITVPEDWDKDMIEFRYGESTWCADSVIQWLTDRLKRWKRDIKKLYPGDDGNGRCLCDQTTVSYVREATAEDEARDRLFVDKPPEGRTRVSARDKK